MLDLHDVAAWRRLDDAYGPADKIPGLLQRLEDLPPRELEDELDGELSLWPALVVAICHQDTVYSASYAAVPHLVRIARTHPTNERAFDALQIAALIETNRLCGRGPVIPEELRGPYNVAVQLMPIVVAELLRLHKGEDDARIAMCAIAAAMGQGELAFATVDLLRD